MKQVLEQSPATVVRHLQHLQKTPWRPRRYRHVSLTISVGVSLSSTDSPSRKSSSGALCGASETNSIDARPCPHASLRWRLCKFSLVRENPGCAARGITFRGSPEATAEPSVQHFRAARLQNRWLLTNNPDLSPEPTQLTSAQANATESSESPRAATAHLFGKCLPE